MRRARPRLIALFEIALRNGVKLQADLCPGQAGGHASNGEPGEVIGGREDDGGAGGQGIGRGPDVSLREEHGGRSWACGLHVARGPGELAGSAALMIR